MPFLTALSHPLLSSRRVDRISWLLPAILVLAFLFAPRPASSQPIQATVDSSRSVIDYTGSAVAHDWTGTSRTVTGQITLNPEIPDSSRVRIQAPVASFDSGNDRRDRKMRRVTEASRYPLVQFQSDDVRPESWGRSADGFAGRWRTTGQLTFHGRTHDVEALVTVRTTKDSVFARTQFPVSLTQFDVERPELLFVPIADTIRIDAQVVGRRDRVQAVESRSR
jgi:polyisoprenoid-binding protein YceI